MIESPYHIRQYYVKRAREQAIIVIAAAVLIATIMALLYVLRISRNFRQLIKATKAIAQGNYSRRVRLITNPMTPYEIIILGGEFNRMAKKMEESWKNIRQLNQELILANQQLSRLDEFKSNLIDTVSHELRTPLTLIKGHTSRLLRHHHLLKEEDGQRALKTIKLQTDRLSRLVEDLLVIPDLETGSIRVYLDTVDVYEVLKRCLEFIQEKDARPIQVLGDRWPVLNHCLVKADPDRLEQIILNLLDNALKYASDETAPVVIQLNQLEKTQHLECSVSNVCDPIDEKTLSTLFGKFKRLDERLTRTTRGSGLGLFITKGLVEAMGGSIQVRFAEDRFKVLFYLPLV
jgi:signal transduction histidine kinase